MELDNLNEPQKEAVITTEGPLLVLAGAGSGKTRVLTTRVAYLILEKNINPYNVLAITFTNKAAKEMKSRIEDMIGSISSKIQISTFHSFGLTIIRENYELLGLNKNFTILDSEDTSVVIKNIIKDLNIEENFRMVKSTISNNKNALIDYIDYERFANGDYEKNVLEIYKRYTNKLKLNNSVDFDDLLMLPIVLFKKHPEVLAGYQERFKYILIDEYQDTNEAQYLLAKMISSKYKNICVVGDDSQSIYSWRGSNYKNILNFEKDYHNCKTILLEQNYRSTQTIINASNDIIKNNKNRKDKNLWTDNEEGKKIEYNTANNEKDEARYVIEEIEKLVNSGVDYHEITILYRTNGQSRNFEDALLLTNIPYKVVGGFNFYGRKEIKDLMAYLKLIYNHDDDVSFLRIVNVPKRKIGNITLDKLNEEASLNNTSLYNAIKTGKELEFKALIEELTVLKETLSLTDLVEQILVKTGLRKEVEEDKLENEARLENLEEFKSITFQFEDKYGIISLEDFLAEVSLVADIEDYKNNDNAITLMTIHNAKGLEFNYVFLVGVEERILPHFNSLENKDALEEERRLCYVAVTRAKKGLWLTNASIRTLYGNKVKNKPSRFIKEISNIHFNTVKNTKIIDNIDTNTEYNVGDHIVFDKYGEGVIVSIKGRILNVAFAHPHGIKMLIKGHKNIRRV